MNSVLPCVCVALVVLVQGALAAPDNVDLELFRDSNSLATQANKPLQSNVQWEYMYTIDTDAIYNLRGDATLNQGDHLYVHIRNLPANGDPAVEVKNCNNTDREGATVSCFVTWNLLIGDKIEEGHSDVAII